MISDLSILGVNGNKPTENSTGLPGAAPTGGIAPARADRADWVSPVTVASPSSSPSLAPARSEGAHLVLAALAAQPIQPVADVQTYLQDRVAQPSFSGEEHLLITLPAKVQGEVKALVRACEFCKALVGKKLSIQAACREVVRVFATWGWKARTFEPKFSKWLKDRDWVGLVNRAKAGPLWQAASAKGLPPAFLVFMESKFGQFKRADGKRQALFSVKRQWQTGRNDAGEEAVIPGYEVLADGSPFSKRDRENFPPGWSYSNILTQIKKRARFTSAVRALLHDSTSAAMQYLPQVLGTRRGLRFLEKITFDDVRTDWVIVNPASGQAEEMWVLVARDEATAMVLGFVMLPATVREDGKATHLGAQQMKELAGYLLQTYPLPVGYVVHWVVERGTATLAEAVRLALGELFDHRIKVHYTSMIGGKSPLGYKEKKKGNSRGKASHESHNRLFHTQGSWIGGQTGNHYDIRPAELKERCDEARAIYLRSQDLPEHLRESVKYPLPTPAIAREKFKEFCVHQNFRTDHTLEDFEKVVEWWDGAKWQAISELRPPDAKLRTRMERPVERALRLIKSVAKWDRCSPDIIKTFLEHTARSLTVTPAGEIEITVEGRKLTFAAPTGLPLAPNTKALGYYHPDDPQFLHVTSGDGRFYGTWYQRGRTEYLDAAALAQAMRYTHAAHTAALTTARELAAPETADLEAMRAHNASLQAFTVTADAPGTQGVTRPTAIAAHLSLAPRAVAAAKKAEAKMNLDIDDALRNALT